MAEVFKAKSYGVEGFEKIIAIKRILPTMGEDRDFIKMFIDEAKIAGQLAHANICQIFELGRIDGAHFIAMEYIWGKDLLQIQNRLRKNKQPMPIPMACFVIAKVLEGLDYAHRKRDPLGRPLEIVHRDCSPQNVLVSYEGEVKVIDFGIAKATSRNSRTMAGVLKGKFGYMSPEQVRGLPLDRRSDIFALGTMLYECLTGARLFQGETDFSTLEKVRNVDVQNPRAINPNIPEQVERVIMKALAKDVEDRYQWCSDMLADLQAYLMSQEVVFTAKTLSAWLKEVFAVEIERERQQLEQYKRVGRDGLIAGVPAAEAKLDVVETLGEAGMPEGDATQLGGPSFEELEQAMAAAAAANVAAPEAGPAPGSPAAGPPPPDDGDFGEEAPTEIFGDVDNPPVPAPAPAPVAARAPTSAPQSRPPRPPPGRPTSQGQVPLAPAAAGTPSPRPPTVPPPGPAGAEQGFVPALGSQPGAVQPAPGYNPAAPYPPQQFPYATQPPVPAQPPGAPAPAKTLLGQMSPVAGNYGPSYRVTGQQPAYPQGYPTQQPQQPQHAPQGYPSQQMQGYPGPMQTGPMHTGQMQNMPPGAPVMSGYPQQSQMPAYLQSGAYGPMGTVTPPGTPAVEATQHVERLERRRKSSIGRDVAIGIAIAALVLGGFFVVKLFVLDDDGDGAATDATAAASTIATIRLSLPADVSADLFVDDKKIGSFRDGNEVPVSAGSRKVKLVGPSSTQCEQQLELPGGKTTPVQCQLEAAKAAPQPTPSAPADPTEVPAGSGSANTEPAGPGAGSGSGATDPTPPVDKAAGKPDEKPIETAPEKPVEKAPDKPVEKAPVKPVEKKTAEKATVKTVDRSAEKVAADRSAEKAVATKATVDRGKAEKTSSKPAADKDGYLVVTSKPVGAKILIDGKPTGMTTPTSKITVAPGRHKVTFVVGSDKFTFAVLVKAGETLTLNKELQ